MNAPFLTQAADGIPRRGFTNADIERMVEAGVLEPDEPLELIRGEIVPMPSEHDLHGRARALLMRAFIEALGREWFVSTELSLFLAEDVEFKPDLHVFPASLKSHEVLGPEVLIAIELAASSQRRDFGLKAPIYAEYGVKELWVLDLDAKIATVFRDPSPAGYAVREERPADAVLSPLAFPNLQVRLADLL